MYTEKTKLYFVNGINSNDEDALCNDYYAGNGCGNVVDWLWDGFLVMLLLFYMFSSGCGLVGYGSLVMFQVVVCGEIMVI